MTRKDYIILANILHSAIKNKELNAKTVAHISNELAQELVNDNPGFLKSRWDRAVLIGGNGK